ncbi:PP0621 family protein [Cupriavidus pauculus]|uniref:Uncharacterized protein n=1 Tax=Cupriavidus pauculus TaxID=82633 RepID=A0A3G8GZE3_9BURK|nr:PP0621 family protein [Cupriavidus pauculus]AZG13375.1 hypothetical protein EHF44_07915 [Cupriavidus pauculus]
MARIFLLLAVVLGILWWLRARASAQRGDEQAQAQARREAARADGADGSSEPMVQCAQCGVHLPGSDAIAWHGLHYCRRSHLPDSAGEGGA